MNASAIDPLTPPAFEGAAAAVIAVAVVRVDAGAGVVVHAAGAAADVETFGGAGRPSVLT